MTDAPMPRPRVFAAAEVLYYGLAFAFFAYLLQYYLTTTGGPTLLAFTVVPITFIIYTLN